MMLTKSRIVFFAVITFSLTASAQAGGIDVLRGKFGFDWFHDPAKGKCVQITDKLLVEFKSKRYTCDLSVKKNTSTEVGARTCTTVPQDKEYLIFDTKRQCDDERETQASNE